MNFIDKWDKYMSPINIKKKCSETIWHGYKCNTQQIFISFVEGTNIY